MDGDGDGHGGRGARQPQRRVAPSWSRRRIAKGGLALGGLVALAPLSIWACRKDRAAGADPTEPPEAHGWPHDGSLRTLAIEVPRSFGKRKVWIDAGHGAEDNTGNLSAFCVDEQDFTRELADQLTETLTRTGAFEVGRSRTSSELVPYRRRAADADAFGAEAFVSLHSDARGAVAEWEHEGRSCPRGKDPAVGFSVLYSDDPAGSRVAGRARLARELSRALLEAGFPAYSGRHYEGLYAPDAAADGVFIDRHEPHQRIFVLYKPGMASVIIETHHALNPDETKRWNDKTTRDAFCAASAVALIAALA